METAKQVSVFLENKPGRLANVLTALARAKVNVTALTIMDSHEHSVLRLVTDDITHTLDVLRSLNVTFTEADVLHVGDTWWNGIYPFIDYSTGGSIDGAIRAAEANIAAVTPQTIVIPGHGAPGGKSDLIAFRDMLVEIRAKVAALKKQGRSLDDAVAAKPTAAYDARWGQFLITPRFFTTLVFQGV